MGGGRVGEWGMGVRIKMMKGTGALAGRTVGAVKGAVKGGGHCPEHTTSRRVRSDPISPDASMRRRYSSIVIVSCKGSKTAHRLLHRVGQPQGTIQQHAQRTTPTGQHRHHLAHA